MVLANTYISHLKLWIDDSLEAPKKGNEKLLHFPKVLKKKSKTLISSETLMFIVTFLPISEKSFIFSKEVLKEPLYPARRCCRVAFVAVAFFH